MTWVDCLTDEINLKINPPHRILWIRRTWQDLRAFFLGLISVTNDFPSDIEQGSPWGTPVPWKRICRVEWWWWEPCDTCVLLQWGGMHNACGFNQTLAPDSTGVLSGVWLGLSSWVGCCIEFLEALLPPAYACKYSQAAERVHTNTHTHACRKTHTHNHTSPSWSPPAPDVVLQHPDLSLIGGRIYLGFTTD